MIPHNTIKSLLETYPNEPLEMLKHLGGYYECEKDSTGQRLTPLVGYAGKYISNDGVEKQYVGEVYINFAKTEEYPQVLFHLAKMLWDKIKAEMQAEGSIVFVGPQMGGIAIAEFLAYHAGAETDARYACAEKKITQLKSDTMREQSDLVFARHSIEAGDKVIIVEDVMNNFSTTKKLIDLAESKGASVILITGLLNRSDKYEDTFPYSETRNIPVQALVRKTFPEYKQEDIEVALDMSKGNVVLKPKDDWAKLAK